MLLKPVKNLSAVSLTLVKNFSSVRRWHQRKILGFLVISYRYQQHRGTHLLPVSTTPDHWKSVTRINRRCHWHPWTTDHRCCWHRWHSFENISANIQKNQNGPKGMIHEKIFVSKSYFVEIMHPHKMTFCWSSDSVPLKCVEIHLHLICKIKGWMGLSPPRTWTKETLSTHPTAFLGRNHG